MMARPGGRPGYGTRRGFSFSTALILILFAGCVALGLTLFSARNAHDTLLEQLKEQERKNTAMRQTIAEVKVESVDNLTKSRDLEMEKEHLSSEVMASNAKMNEDKEKIEQLQTELRDAKDAFKAAEQRVGEVERRLANRVTEAHVLKKALYQYKHQIVNLGQELDILRDRMKKAGLIEEAKILLPKGKRLSPPLQEIAEIEATAAAAVNGDVLVDEEAIEDMPEGVDKEVMEELRDEQVKRQRQNQEDEGNAKASQHDSDSKGVEAHELAAVQAIADQHAAHDENYEAEEDDDEGTA